ncbi:MAG: hypothetical protein ACRDCS_00235 [Tannerellaceae bacterium]
MSILEHLLIPDQPFAKKEEFNAQFLTAKIEAIASVYKKLILILNHATQKLIYYNFNKDIYPITGANPYLFDIKKTLSHIETSDRNLLWRYQEIINKSFVGATHQKDDAIYFSVDFVYLGNEKIDACRTKVIPYQYDNNDNLLVTLCIIEPINFAGSAILRKHDLISKTTSIYSNTTKQFEYENTPYLSEVECNILHLSGQGVKEINIARQLDMTLPRLKRIKTLIFEKLNVSSISEAIYISYKRGYLDATP